MAGQLKLINEDDIKKKDGEAILKIVLKKIEHIDAMLEPKKTGKEEDLRYLMHEKNIYSFLLVSLDNPSNLRIYIGSIITLTLLLITTIFSTFTDIYTHYTEQYEKREEKLMIGELYTDLYALQLSLKNLMTENKVPSTHVNDMERVINNIGNAKEQMNLFEIKSINLAREYLLQAKSINNFYPKYQSNDIKSIEYILSSLEDIEKSNIKSWDENLFITFQLEIILKIVIFIYIMYIMRSFLTWHKNGELLSINKFIINYYINKLDEIIKEF